MNVSFVPANVEVKDYDHLISFDEATFIGIEERDMKFIGKGNEGELDEFDIEGVVTKLRLEFQLKD